MSGISPVQSRSSDTHAAIAQASAATGVDFDFLLAQARIESNLNPDARAGTSSAAGLYQFINSTWLETLDRHGATHGLHWAGDAITQRGGRATVDDYGLRSQIMALRYDPQVSSLMAAELARDNAIELGGFLGRKPDHAELYLAHFLGAGGARDFLGALRDTPEASAAALFPAPARSNRPIFFSGGRPRSVEEVMQLLRDKVSAAGSGGATEFSPHTPPAAAPSSGSAGFTYASHQFEEQSSAPRRVSMADTLASAFGGSGQLEGRAAQQVNEAYGKLRTFGL